MQGVQDRTTIADYIIRTWQENRMPAWQVREGSRTIGRQESQTDR
jgi:hypothetical protein